MQNQSILMVAQVGRAMTSGEYDALYKSVHEGRISLAKHWIESTKIRENAAARARRQIRNFRIEQFWRSNYELDPDKHTYSIETLLDFRDQAAEVAALQKMREMEWSRSDGLLAAIPAYEGGDPLDDPMIENFIQRVFFDDDNAGDDIIDDDEAGMFADDDMDFTEGYMTDASTLATDTERPTMDNDFMPVEEELWTIEEEDDASLEEFDSPRTNVPTPPAEMHPIFHADKIEVSQAGQVSGVSVTELQEQLGNEMPVLEVDQSALEAAHETTSSAEWMGESFA
jgi:hypothetical protein